MYRQSGHPRFLIWVSGCLNGMIPQTLHILHIVPIAISISIRQSQFAFLFPRFHSAFPNSTIKFPFPVCNFHFQFAIFISKFPFRQSKPPFPYSPFSIAQTLSFSSASWYRLTKSGIYSAGEPTRLGVAIRLSYIKTSTSHRFFLQQPCLVAQRNPPQLQLSQTQPPQSLLLRLAVAALEVFASVDRAVNVHRVTPPDFRGTFCCIASVNVYFIGNSL